MMISVKNKLKKYWSNLNYVRLNLYLLLIDQLLLGSLGDNLRCSVTIYLVLLDWHYTAPVDHFGLVGPDASLSIHGDLLGLVYVDGHGWAKNRCLHVTQTATVNRHSAAWRLNSASIAKMYQVRRNLIDCSDVYPRSAWYWRGTTATVQVFFVVIRHFVYVCLNLKPCILSKWKTEF